MSIDNIIAIYEQATTKEIKDGVLWYKRAKHYRPIIGGNVT